MADLVAALSKKVKKFKVGDVEVRFKPRVKEVATLMAVSAKMADGSATQEDIEALLNAVVDMIARAYPPDELNREDIEAFVVENLEAVMTGIADAMGLTKGQSFRGGQ